MKPEILKYVQGLWQFDEQIGQGKVSKDSLFNQMFNLGLQLSNPKPRGLQSPLYKSVCVTHTYLSDVTEIW